MHLIWYGSDLNAKRKQPPCAAWKMVCTSKVRGLGVINLKAQNVVLLMKEVHKFFNHGDFLGFILFGKVIL